MMKYFTIIFDEKVGVIIRLVNNAPVKTQTTISDADITSIQAILAKYVS